MSILKIKDSSGNWIPIPAIKGEPGDDYVLTAADKAEIAGLLIDDTATSDTDKTWSSDKIESELDNKISDVKINGTSVVDAQGAANIPIASADNFGVVKKAANTGVMIGSDGIVRIDYAGAYAIKSGSNTYNSITPGFQNQSVFYGLAKAAGDSTQQSSSNTVGQYTDSAKEAIQGMLGVPSKEETAPAITNTVSGSTLHFTDGIESTAKNVTIKITPAQSGSGDPSPTNVRPISGFTGATITVANGTDSTAEDYEYYDYSVDWSSEAGTVYYGSLDMNTGELTITHEKITITDNDWQWQSTVNSFYVELSDYPELAEIETSDPSFIGLCDSYKFVPYVSMINTPVDNGCSVRVDANAKRIYVRTDGTQSTTPGDVDFVLEYAIPYTYYVYSPQIDIFEGENVITSDIGCDISVSYKADTKEYVDNATPVKDVKINGTSIVDANGNANILPATTTRIGAIMVGPNASGLEGDSGNFLKVVGASGTMLQRGTDTRRAVMPSTQHQSVFYGLSKAAGVDLANETVTLGTYPDAAKVAIQKMLGVYEAPWELIREDTGTNATSADIDVIADANGQSFELTDIRLVFYTPKQDTEAVVGDYGRVYFYYGSGSSQRDNVYLGAYTQAAQATARVSAGQILQKDGMIERTMWKNATTNSEKNPISILNVADGTNTLWELATKTYIRMVISSVMGSWGYRLYGKRKWQ